VLTEQELAWCLGRYWGLDDVRLAVHDGGMGSKTWIAERAGRRWVAKAVAPRDGRPLAAGLAIARRVEQAGIPAGAPEPAADGQLAVDVGDAWLALLTWVPGHELTGEDDTGQELIGRTLAQVHRALVGFEVPDAQRFHWVDPDAAYLTLRKWLRPAITAALNALEEADPSRMARGLLHADPAPGAFRLDPATGRCGVIDWSYAIDGPLLYDLASAVMYAGGPEEAQALIGAYLAAGMLTAGEVRHGLAAMLRFRWAVQASYFAWRIAQNELTGISGPEGNEVGLEAARLALAEPMQPPG
jgi:Ser/Thr protein kinase RdoA (MazF antagonist)